MLKYKSRAKALAARQSKDLISENQRRFAWNSSPTLPLFSLSLSLFLALVLQLHCQFALHH